MADTPSKEFIIRFEPGREQDPRLPAALAYLIKLADSKPKEENHHE